MVAQRSVATLATTLIGAVWNLAGIFFLIRLWGSMGAAISTLLRYVLIFSVRAIHTRTMIRVRCNILKLLISAIMLGTQCILEQDAESLLLHTPTGKRLKTNAFRRFLWFWDDNLLDIRRPLVPLMQEHRSMADSITSAIRL